jgi:competence protein ComEC
MFSLISIGRISGRSNQTMNTIFFSALLLLCYNPNYLFDIGFQLSYTAVIGIITFQPLLASWFIKQWHIPKVLADLMAVSLAAQIGTAPICIHIFNSFPTYFLLTNIWIIPLVTIVINVAVVLILLGLFGLSTTWIAYPLDWLLKGMNWGVEYISHLPHALSDLLYIDKISVLLAYTTIILIALAIYNHSKRLLYTCLVTVILCLVYNHHEIEREKEKSSLFVFKERDAFNICVQQGLQGIICCEKDSMIKMPTYFIHHHMAKQVQDSCSLSDSFKSGSIVKNKDFIISENHIHTLFTKDIEMYSAPFSSTSLIIDHEEPKSIYSFYNHFKFKELVLNRRPNKSSIYYENFCEKNNISLHKVYEDGAYIIDL